MNDDDLLFSVTLRSGKPTQDLVIPDANNVHLAGYAQDDWRVHPRLSLNLGVRYEIDTDVNNISRVDELNPIVAPFVTAPRHRDINNCGAAARLQLVHAGCAAPAFAAATASTTTASRSRSNRSSAGSTAARCRSRCVPATCSSSIRRPAAFPPFAPTVSNPFTGFILPGAGASGINIIDPHLQNPMVQQASIGVERQIGARQIVRVDVVHNHGTDFIIGRTVGTVFNPVVGGPDRVVNLESSAKTDYDGCWSISNGASPGDSACGRRTRCRRR